jgi:ABC-type dipeptide/oligopeptide/nickel transport system permease subunit
MRAAWSRYRGNRSAVWAAVGLGALILFCLAAPPLSPYDPYAVDFSQKLETPTPRHLLGTDLFGRDLLERMALGGRTTMFIALMATGIILVLGLLYGAVSGLAGRKVDDLMMRIVDGLFAIPRLPWVLIVLVLIGANGSIFTVILALSLFSWMTTARLVRSQILALKQNDFVRAAPWGPVATTSSCAISCRIRLGSCSSRSSSSFPASSSARRSSPCWASGSTHPRRLGGTSPRTD